MAANIYRQNYADKTSQLRRRAKKQGRPEKDAELKRNNRIAVDLNKIEYDRFMQRVAESGMSKQAYAQFALSCFDMQLFVTNNS